MVRRPCGSRVLPVLPILHRLVTDPFASPVKVVHASSAMLTPFIPVVVPSVIAGRVIA